ncbi:hypothetical protein OMD50_16140, partial [Dethiobacter alkaliphilus]|nr:hypothetical protein [Dethiobacter alkaliphilus]
AFLLPFFFIWNPQLLMIDTIWYRAMLTAAITFVGLYCIAAIVQRWLITQLRIADQFILSVIAIALLWPNLIGNFVGIFAFALFYLKARSVNIS